MRSPRFLTDNIALTGHLQPTYSYDRLLIQAIVTAAYLGWIAYGATHLLLPPSSLTAPASSPLGVLPAAVVLLVAWVLFALQHAPGTYYVYIAFPVFFWHQSIALGFKPWNEAVRSGRIALADVLRWALRAAGVVLALMAMAVRLFSQTIWCRQLILGATGGLH